MDTLQKSLFEAVTHFANQTEPTIDWASLFDSEDEFTALVEAFDVLIDAFALLPNIQKDERIKLLGKLILIRSEIVFCHDNQKDLTQFVHYGYELETLLHEVLNCSDWLTLAEQHIESFFKLQENGFKPTVQQMITLRPCVALFAFVTVITADDNPTGNDKDDGDEDDDDYECYENDERECCETEEKFEF